MASFHRGSVLAVSIATLVGACGGETKPPKTPDAPRPIEGHLLAFPHADAEGLLGHEVTRAENGSFHISEARLPGCDVIVRRKKAQYHALRETKTSDLASIGAGYQQFLSLEAKYGKESQARLELENTDLVEADLRGPCGRTVITKVFVGHGSRRVFAASHKEGGLTATAPGIGQVSPKASSDASDVDELAWQEPQAYAFEVRELEPAKGDDASLSLDVKLPSIVTEGEEIHASFESDKTVWLVVYYVDSENNAEVLWPSNEEPLPRATPERPARLPSSTEEAAGIKIRPTLAKPGANAREQLVVYAFSDVRDYQLVKPASGSSSKAGLAFADELAAKLVHVPASRWSKKVLGYTIVPKAAPAPAASPAPATPAKAPPGKGPKGNPKQH